MSERNLPIGGQWAYASMEACTYVRREYAALDSMACRAVLVVCGYGVITIGATSTELYMRAMDRGSDNDNRGGPYH